MSGNPAASRGRGLAVLMGLAAAVLAVWWLLTAEGSVAGPGHVTGAVDEPGFGSTPVESRGEVLRREPQRRGGAESPAEAGGAIPPVVETRDPVLQSALEVELRVPPAWGREFEFEVSIDWPKAGRSASVPIAGGECVRVPRTQSGAGVVECTAVHIRTRGRGRVARRRFELGAERVLIDVSAEDTEEGWGAVRLHFPTPVSGQMSGSLLTSSDTRTTSLSRDLPDACSEVVVLLFPIEPGAEGEVLDLNVGDDRLRYVIDSSGFVIEPMRVVDLRPWAGFGRLEVRVEAADLPNVSTDAVIIDVVELEDSRASFAASVQRPGGVQGRVWNFGHMAYGDYKIRLDRVAAAFGGRFAAPAVEVSISAVTPLVRVTLRPVRIVEARVTLPESGGSLQFERDDDPSWLRRWSHPDREECRLALPVGRYRVLYRVPGGGERQGNLVLGPRGGALAF